MVLLFISSAACLLFSIEFHVIERERLMCVLVATLFMTTSSGGKSTTLSLCHLRKRQHLIPYTKSMSVSQGVSSCNLRGQIRHQSAHSTQQHQRISISGGRGARTMRCDDRSQMTMTCLSSSADCKAKAGVHEEISSR